MDFADHKGSDGDFCHARQFSDLTCATKVPGLLNAALFREGRTVAVTPTVLHEKWAHAKRGQSPAAGTNGGMVTCVAFCDANPVIEMTYSKIRPKTKKRVT